MNNGKQTQPKKIKMLLWGDSPAASTGFATVIRGVFNELAKTGKYDFDVIGINDRGGWKDPKEFPYRIYPAHSNTEVNGDFHGRGRLVASVFGKDTDLKPPWDIIFTLNDPFILEQRLPAFDKGALAVLNEASNVFRKKLPPEYYFRVVSYWPVDSEIKGNWVKDAIQYADHSVAYTEYGKKEILDANRELNPVTDVEKKLSVIYHGINLQNFQPLDKNEIKEFKKEFFRGVVHDHTFLVLSVARNQQRKDLPRTFAIFKEFQKRRPDSFLYIHAQENDAWGSLKEYARHFNLEFGKDWGVPSKFNANTGYPIEALNMIYNSADCILSTTHGEGWGFYNSEGFATKKVVVAPDNTVHPELFGYKAGSDISDMEELYKAGVRGVPFKCGSNLSEWTTYGPQDLERYRPIGNVEDAVKKLVWVYDNPDKAAEIAERGYQWIQQYSWQNVAKQWDELFTKIYGELEKERADAHARADKQAVPAPAQSK